MAPHWQDNHFVFWHAIHKQHLVPTGKCGEFSNPQRQKYIMSFSRVFHWGEKSARLLGLLVRKIINLHHECHPPNCHEGTLHGEEVLLIWRDRSTDWGIYSPSNQLVSHLWQWECLHAIREYLARNGFKLVQYVRNVIGFGKEKNISFNQYFWNFTNKVSCW